ncbi:response regulator transcription factor [Clostridium folliculivorans]|uniref:Stage 0 sporulation protein A homolog n=1 Tax=Clostridium folliculivorans TaxID=2886038 RepID=A0A9W6DBP5_9CLOT|nr:response regulator transcription factor [Clostridium folliculivorans]GKU25923.1 DNA-binding response regulator [Clostridium folliculivorans]GKU28009.1 DNA-binding response regulator [Clostridium folliculivorans]
MDKIKIIIVDDEKLIREGLKIILSTYEDIEVLALCEDGHIAYEFCKSNKVDVVLMDIRMDNCDGVLGTKLIKKLNAEIKILILTTFKDSEYIEEALKNGASGYLLKDSSYDLIYGGIKAAFGGNIVVHPDIVSKLVVKENDRDDSLIKERLKEETGLTERELTIVEEIANGLSNKEIGEKMYLTEGTIKNNITTILSKLALRDRTQIAIFAFKNNLIK